VRCYGIGRSAALARQVASFDPEAAQPRHVEVDHRPEQIGVEGVWRAEVPKASDDSHERLVHEVLGLNPAPREQVREPDRHRDVASV
jgi:hypothetical protein